MSESLRLSKFKFYAGRKPGKSPTEIEPGTVVIFVGPNNSGKSLALREIENWCFGQDTNRKVVDSMEIDFPREPEVAEALAREFETLPPPNQSTAPGTFWVGQHTFRQDEPVRNFSIDVNRLKDATSRKELTVLRQWLSASYTVRLDGRTRFSLADPKPTGDLQYHAQNHLWALFKNDVARERVRKLTEDAFNLHFVIDPIAITTFRIRMSSRPPASKSEEQSLDEAARSFHANAQLINELSDGVQAFVGLVSAVLSLPHKIILVDEPEAFLHPPLARRLGNNLASITRERDASLVVATHSPEFVMGCLEAVGDMSVVRLTYEAGVATARALPSDDISMMTRDPLLRSTGLLRALFHRAAIVTESDTDRAFYDEINRRLDSAHRGIRDSIFLNAQNWQTIHRVVGPLRRIGIPVAAIADLDVLEQGGTNWKNLLASCQIPAAEMDELERKRAYLAGVFSAVGEVPNQARAIKSQGLNALNTTDRTRAKALLKELSKYGVFLVPGGELESWLSRLGVPGQNAEWLINMFSRIGQTETDHNYLRPEPDDVWEFIDGIADWVNDPQRLGTD